MPFANGFSIYGKLGMAYNHIDGGTVCSPTCLTATSDHGYQPLYGVGAGYTFTQNWGMRLEYDYFGKVSSNDMLGNRQ